MKTPKRFMRLVFLLISVTVLLGQTSNVSAHPADMYFQTFNVSLSPANITIEWNIKPGPILANYLWNFIDSNQDGVVDNMESDAWGRQTAALLIATDNSASLQLDYTGIRFPADIYSFQSGADFIVITLEGSLPKNESGEHRISLHGQFEEKTSISWFYLTALDNSAFAAPEQQGGKLSLVFYSQNKNGENLLTKWDSGSPSLPAGQKKDAVTSTAEEIIPELKTKSPQDILTNLVRQEQFSLSFYLFALGISIGLGALHALTPGHGKTVVAAYLVGSRGTTRHAIALGSIVTLTHTGSVFLLGIVTLVASRYFLPTRLIPVLEILSGLLIVGLGIGLLYSRWKAWRNPGHTPSHSHEHTHEHEEHNHDHGRSHSHDIPSQLTWRSLIALGISGGLVPCPDAVAILLVAIAINRIVLGLSLIVAFSLGLAVVLILIGLAMVHSSRLFNRMEAFNKFAPALPLVSAAAVTILGLALTYGAAAKVFGEANAGQTAAGSGSAREAGAALDSNSMQIVFLGLDESAQRQVMIEEIGGGNIQTLTHAAAGVSYFALSPDNKKILYVSNRADRGSSLWLYDLAANENRLLADCPGFICSQAAWSPDGRRVIYEKLSLNAQPDSLGLPALWWVDATNGITKSVFQDSNLPGINPRWSPDGKWLSYSAPGDGIHIQNLETNENRVVSSAVMAAAYWKPDSAGFLFNDGYTQDERFITRLYFYDLKTGEIKTLSHDLALEDNAASWSPDGNKIAVIRRELGATAGDQIWIMNADGSGARPLTDTPSVIHDGLNWSPDGNYLLAHAYLLDKPLSEPVMTMINIKTAEITELGEGLRPAWVSKTKR